MIFPNGLLALVGDTELLVRGASRPAFSFAISPLVIGEMTEAFGRSLPRWPAQ